MKEPMGAPTNYNGGELWGDNTMGAAIPTNSWVNGRA